MDFDKLKEGCPAKLSGDRENCSIQPAHIVGMGHIVKGTCSEKGCPIFYWINVLNKEIGHEKNISG